MGGRKKTLQDVCLTRSSVYSIYSVFCCPVRINYNLPAGYGASAVVMAEALYPHGRFYPILHLLLPPSFFPRIIS